MQWNSAQNYSWSSQHNVSTGLILPGHHYLGPPTSTVHCYVTLKNAALLPGCRSIAVVDNSLTSIGDFFNKPFINLEQITCFLADLCCIQVD